MRYLISLLFIGGAAAQCGPGQVVRPIGNGQRSCVNIGVTVIGPKTIGVGANQIPSAASCSGCIAVVTDASTSADCTVGGGTSTSLCRSNGTTWSSLGGGGGGGSNLLTVVANTTNGTVSATNLQRTILTNTGASAQVTLTLGTATCTVGQAFTAYLTVAQPFKFIPFTGDKIQTLTSAANHSITSDSVIGSFVSLACLTAGNWFLMGLNGAWTDTN
jgi:hypothetical protein